PRCSACRDGARGQRVRGPVDADGLWKAVDGFEAQQERTRPPLPTSPWKTGTRTPVSHSAPQAAAAGHYHNGACFEDWISLETACHAEGPGGQGSEKAGAQGPENRHADEDAEAQQGRTA